ncbi:Acyltransferase [Planctomycetes bacterium Pan216]|uniref:Acyltransferase n=1 Tax=Kolteria novifilia TaxID=2527975 RepID=A0A518AXP7_9BACT|nr:Acyltransferase [Planctomycetes bacterium Pan216]
MRPNDLMVSDFYFEEPYRFVPPYRSERWLRFFRYILPRRLRKIDQVRRFDFRDAHLLKRSLEDGAGVLLAPNHARMNDPPVLGMLGLHLKRYFYYAASWHLFHRSRFDRFLIRRSGAFSLFREGIDRQALRECGRILSEAERPLVLFPEGTYFWHNDAVGPLREGISLIGRNADKAGKEVLIHPVGIKYWYLNDPRNSFAERLDSLETIFGWYPRHGAGLVDRVLRIEEAFLSAREIEYLGESQTGPLHERLLSLNEHLLSELEKRRFGASKQGDFLQRCWGLRQQAVKRLSAEESNRHDRDEAWRDLSRLWLCQQLVSHQPEYLLERPSLERIGEAIHRMEEDLKGVTPPLAPMGAAIQVGEPITLCSPTNNNGDSRLLSARVRSQVQHLIDQLLADGPPRRWACPPRIEREHAFASTPPIPAPVSLSNG